VTGLCMPHAGKWKRRGPLAHPPSSERSVLAVLLGQLPLPSSIVADSDMDGLEGNSYNLHSLISQEPLRSSANGLCASCEEES
jgi:hypothetical protein